MGADFYGTAQFFKGVATVCTKLFNAVEVGDTLHRGAFIRFAYSILQPDHAYFGQKDIQQALLLKIRTSDNQSLLSPDTPAVHISRVL